MTLVKEVPRKRGRPVASSEKRREQILEAGAKVFLKKGFHAARIEDIVAEARLGKGTFYLYFTDKEDLFRALVDQLFGEVKQTLLWVREGISPKASVADLFRAETDRFFTTFTEYKDVAMVIIREGRSVSPAIEKKISEFYEEIIEQSRQTLEFAIGFGLLPKFDPRIAAICIVGGIEKIYEQWLFGKIDGSQEAIVLEASEFLQRGCGIKGKSRG